MTVPAVRFARSDTDLVSSIASGDLEALGALFDRHEPALRRFFARLGIGAADADDLVQATFLDVMRAAPRFDPSFQVRSWLYGLASIMARRHRRSVARTAKRLLGWASLSVFDAPRTPAAELDREQELQHFRAAFERLAPKKREVFVLVVLEGLSGDEAARALQVPVNTIWTRLHHARRELKRALEASR